MTIRLLKALTCLYHQKLADWVPWASVPACPWFPTRKQLLHGQASTLAHGTQEGSETGSKPAFRNFVSAAGITCAVAGVLFSGCAEPADRIEVVSNGEGRIDVKRVPKDHSAPAAPSAPVMAQAQLSPPAAAPLAATPLQPAAEPTDAASRQQRVEELQGKVREMNAEIERLKQTPATVPTTTP